MITASSAGSASSASGGGYQRSGPVQEKGEARPPNTGSSNTRRPSISTNKVEWPSQVTRRPEAGGDAKSAALRGTTGGGASGTVCADAPKSHLHNMTVA